MLGPYLEMHMESWDLVELGIQGWVPNYQLGTQRWVDLVELGTQC